MTAAVRTADEHPVATAFVVWAVLLAGLLVWALLDDDPVLLGRAAVAHRTSLYGQIGASAVALLAVALTVLSILIALPDQPRVQELRERPGWRLLQSMLLAAALLCLITLASAHIGGAVDRSERDPMEFTEQLTVATGISALATVAVAGAAFAALLRAISHPPDPSAGRGEGAIPSR
jgi:hypothetical protein